MAEYDDVTIRYHATGLNEIAQAGNIITGINQGLELMGRMLDTVTRATMQFIDTGSMFEKYNIQFETLLRSAEGAKSRMEELSRFAATTPFDLPGVVDAAKTLEAYGLYSERALRAAGDAAAAFGKDFNETALTISAAATGELERLKMYGITSAKLAAEMGHEVRRATVEDLQEIADTVIKIFEHDAAGGMEKLSKSLSGMVSNLGDAWIRFKKEVADVGPFQAVKDIMGAILEEVNHLFKSGEAERVAQAVGEALAEALYGATIAILQAARAISAVANILPKTGAGGAIRALGDEDTAAGRVTGSVGRSLKLLYGTMLGSIVDIGKTDNPAYDSLTRIIDDIIASRERYRSARAMAGWFIAPDQGGLPPRPPSALQQSGAAAAPGWFMSGLGAGDAFRYTGMESNPAQEQEDKDRMEREQRQADRIKELTAVMGGYWSSYYERIAGYSRKWAQGEGKVLKDIWRATREMLGGILGDYIREKAKEAAIGRLDALAKMLTSEGSFNFWSAAKYAASAAAFAAVGAAGGGMVEGFLAAPEPDISVGGSESGGSSDNGRSISRSSAGVKAQSITYNLYVIHNAPAVYGSTDGVRELFETQFLPLLEERGVQFA